MIGKHILKNLMCSYAAGSVGALVNSLAMYIAMILGIHALFGVSVMTGWTLEWLYPRLVWGGVLAFLFVLPYYRSRWVVRGLVWALVPTIPHFFIMFPGEYDLILMQASSFSVGLITLLCMYFFSAIWGVTTSYLMTFFED